jgi:uncharacterized membrane protein YfcA
VVLLGGLIGFASALLGIGGGFLMTPVLMLIADGHPAGRGGFAVVSCLSGDHRRLDTDRVRRRHPAPSAGQPPRPRRERRPMLLYALPLKVRFTRLRIYIGVIPPIALSVFVGALSAIMGAGGGFILVLLIGPRMGLSLFLTPTIRSS